MLPPPRPKIEYEKIKTDDFVVGIIDDIQYEQEHVWPQYDKTKPAKKPGAAVRLKFLIEGYQHPHYSRWMTFNYAEKSNLYLKYLVPLVEGAAPDMRFDLDQLKGLKVKMLWAEKNGFQSIETIRPAGPKVVPITLPEEKEGLAEVAENDEPEDVPF